MSQPNDTVKPDYAGFRITTLHAFTQVGEDDEEGIIAVLGPDDIWVPAITADPVRLEWFRPWAEITARTTGRPVLLSRFDVRTDLETIEP